MQGYLPEAEFFNFKPSFHGKVIERIKHVRVPRGSMVLWDWRIPHKNADQHYGDVPRSVIYTGYLPNVPLNRAYAEEQLENYYKGIPPPDFEDFHQLTDDLSVKHKFSAVGRRLMGIDACKQSV
eukprot:CAMPEP_0206244938 /NCGR_PEP_ID=MMETSP0047_2-20121206/18432_1 /ASSEMBLY_ACC=CAM_ASM_000192 /TAXON_ID=195065 /ORGANISM="Chroomonas mesostigmatica_cf, Strain CCMP1168" /LENGTH=123 /DNA_ID=CAMNT_0053670207 /DNA_START=31 /DNA_END=402 /DNA_ORIENTATION=+